MLISYSHNFLFQHVPKTAGSALYERLEPFGHKPERLLVNRLLAGVGIRVNTVLGPHTWKRFRGHTDMAIVYRSLPRELFDGLYKFAFVRNPWDWLVSRYHFITQSGPGNGQYHRVRKLGGFGEYVRWQGARRRRGQSELLVDTPRNPLGGRLLADFVAKYETLDDDFATICRRVGVDASLPARRNASEHRDYREYYDQATRDYVADRWRHDVELFGYDFDGLASPDRVAVRLKDCAA